MIGRHKFMAVSLAAIVGALSASPSTAQTTQTGPDERRARSWAGNDIVVVGQRDTYIVSDTSAATKTDTPLIEVPQSVQVIKRTLIEEQDRRTLSDALVNVSGVTPVRSEEVLFTSPIVRGFCSLLPSRSSFSRYFGSRPGLRCRAHRPICDRLCEARPPTPDRERR